MDKSPRIQPTLSERALRAVLPEGTTDPDDSTEEGIADWRLLGIARLFLLNRPALRTLAERAHSVVVALAGIVAEVRGPLSGHRGRNRRLRGAWGRPCNHNSLSQGRHPLA
jgi:hypothetical protein